MSVLALFEFKALPARMKEVKAGLAQANEPQGSEAVRPKSIRLFRRAVPGPDTRGVIVAVEFANLASHGAQTSLRDLLQEVSGKIEVGGYQTENLRSIDVLMEVTA